jgi:hypothetical protein
MKMKSVNRCLIPPEQVVATVAGTKYGYDKNDEPILFAFEK